MRHRVADWFAAGFFSYLSRCLAASAYPECLPYSCLWTYLSVSVTPSPSLHFLVLDCSRDDCQADGLSQAHRLRHEPVVAELVTMWGPAPLAADDLLAQQLETAGPYTVHEVTLALSPRAGDWNEEIRSTTKLYLGEGVSYDLAVVSSGMGLELSTKEHAVFDVAAISLGMTKDPGAATICPDLIAPTAEKFDRVAAILLLVGKAREECSELARQDPKGNTDKEQGRSDRWPAVSSESFIALIPRFILSEPGQGRRAGDWAEAPTRQREPDGPDPPLPAPRLAPWGDDSRDQRDRRARAFAARLGRAFGAEVGPALGHCAPAGAAGEASDSAREGLQPGPRSKEVHLVDQSLVGPASSAGLLLLTARTHRRRGLPAKAQVLPRAWLTPVGTSESAKLLSYDHLEPRRAESPLALPRVGRDVAPPLLDPRFAIWAAQLSRVVVDVGLVPRPLQARLRRRGMACRGLAARGRPSAEIVKHGFGPDDSSARRYQSKLAQPCCSWPRPTRGSRRGTDALNFYVTYISSSFNMHILSEFPSMTSFPTDMQHALHTWSSKQRFYIIFAMEDIQLGSNMISVYDSNSSENVHSCVTKARRSMTSNSSSFLADSANMPNGNGHGGIFFSTNKSPKLTATATSHESPSSADFVQALKQSPRNVITCEVGGRVCKETEEYLEKCQSEDPQPEPLIDVETLQTEVAFLSADKTHDPNTAKLILGAKDWQDRGFLLAGPCPEGNAKHHLDPAPADWLEEEISIWLDYFRRMTGPGVSATSACHGSP
ncbi:unnamed protein product, partial [Prorocentrum cordatum]